MLKIIYTLVLLFFGNFYYAQSISGKIADKENNAISFAEIILTKNEIKKTAISDEKGSFTLQLPENGDYLLEILQDGNKIYSKTLTIKGNVSENIRLENFNENTIQGVIISKKVVQQVGDKLYFNVENSVLAKGNNGFEILQKSPKLSTNSEGNILLKNKSATILINGRKTNLSDADLNSYLQSLNSEDIKRIEIQDVASSDQDASTAGGVVNIVLKKNPKGFRAIAKTYYLFRKENYDAYNSSLNMNYGTEKWNIYSDISYYDSRNFGKANGIFNYNDGQKNVNNTEFKQNYDNLGLRLGTMFYPNDKNTIGIEGYYNKNKVIMNSDEDLNIFDNGIQTVNSKNFSLSETPSDLWYITLNYNLVTDSLGSSLRFIGDIGRNNTQPFNDVSSEYPENSLLDNHYLYETNSVSKYYTGQLDWIQKFKKDWKLNLGTKFGSVERDNILNVNYLDNEEWQEDFNQKQDFDNRENISAGYVSLSKTFGKHFLKAGIRIENTDVKGLNNINNQEVKQNYTKLFPNFYYKYDFGEDKNISFNYQRSIARPSFRDLNPFVIKQNDFLYQIGNPDLKPQYNDNFYLDYNFKKQSVSFYAAFTGNMIHNTYYNNNGIVYYQPLNYGNAQGYGLDYSYNSDIFKIIYLNLTTGLFYNVFKPINLDRISGLAFYNNLYARIKTSKSTFIEVFNNYQTPSKYRNSDLSYYYNMDLAFQKTFENNNLIIRFKISDVFNTQKDKNLSHYQDFTFNFYQKMLSRSFALSIQYTIDNQRKIKSSTVQSDNDSRERL